MEYKNYFVAFIDILGFKNIITNSKCEEVLKIFSKFKPQFVDIVINNESLIIAEDIKFKIMSDSIVFYIKEDSKNALGALLSTCAMFQAKLVQMEHPILSRGGIEYGKFYIDNDIMFGPALTQAYLLESQNAKYPRIILNKSLLNQYKDILCSKVIFEDYDKFYAIDFLQMIVCTKDGKKSFDTFCSYLDNILSTSIDYAVREKYLYLKKQTELGYVNIIRRGNGKCQNNHQQ